MSGSRSPQQNVKTTPKNTAHKAMPSTPVSEPRSSQSHPSQSHSQQLEGLAGNEVSSDLSKRELQIVELVSAGMTNQEISNELDISKRTVDNHVSNVLNKTATGNRVALVRWALQSGKVCIDELNCCHLPDA